MLLVATASGCGSSPHTAQTGTQPSPRPATGNTRSPTAANQPNIVLVMTDDQALTQMRRKVLPRVFELLHDRGTTFENAFLTTPDCCPSRATLLTGQYGHNNGVLRNHYGDLRDKRNVLPVWLQRAGYVTAHVGKFLNNFDTPRPTSVAPGWDQWYTELENSEDTYYNWDLSVNGRRVHYGDRNRDYAPRVFARAAERLVRRYVPKEQPFYLELDEIAPHPGPGRPGTGCKGNPVPDPRDTKLFRKAPLPRPPSFNEANVADKPPFIRSLPPLGPRVIDATTRRYRCGLAALREVDRTVGRLYREIRRLGESANTVFVVYTDNGTFLGQHRIAGGKLYPYDEADRTPLLVRLPSRYRKGKPRVTQVRQPVANIDFAPTLVRLAHARPCRQSGHCRVMDGRSLLPLLRGRNPAWASHRPLGIELRLDNANKNHAACHYEGVRLPNVIFVRHTMIGNEATGECIAKIERERYSLSSDPYELHNVCRGGGTCPSDLTQRRLSGLLARIRHCSGIRGRDRNPSGRFCG
jgi:N-acetylglucosamine-6-sulfatase